ncbi:MAG: carboxypeptidase regulatory-like domain-containing protein [Candidatus Sulfotelmatobacter sp.]
MKRIFAFAAILFALSIVFSATFAHAQYRGSIQGVITDASGAVVPGANVTLTNRETGQSFAAVSDEKGIFNFNGLPPSKFSVRVEKTGFKTKEIDSLGINAEQANALNVKLDVGQMTETITVNGEAVPLLDTETANLGGSIQAQEFQKLASIGRDPFQLLQLAPGAFGDGSQSSGGGTNSLPGTSQGGSGGSDGVFKIENGGQITANGARVGENNYQIDGVGTTSVTWGGSSVVTPNEDSIKEIKILTDNYDAENGRYRGAQVQIISQNGTNNVHGSLFFKAHRPGLNAYTKYNGYNSNLPGCPAPCGNVRDDNRFNDWGGTVGGPIIKNRLFGFFSYETLTNQSAASTQGGWYETDALRAFAISGSNAAAFYGFPGVAPFGGTQVDQSCTSIGLTEGTNCITLPGQGLNLGRPLTSALGTFDPGYQSSSNPGTGGDGSGGANNLDPTTADIAFFQNTLSPSNDRHRQFNGRVDFQATSNDLVAFSFYYVPNTSTGINGNGDRQMNTFHSNYKNRAATLLWDHTFGATMANEVRINAAGWANKDLSDNPNAPWGLPQVTFSPTGGMTLQGYGIGSFNGFDQWTYAGKDVLTKVHGAHTMKMGGEFTRLLSVDAPFWADRPGYNFNNIWDFLNDAPISENAQFDPKTGIPSALRKDLRSNIVGLFFQDNYKVTPTLTLTAGLRWEYFGPITEKNGQLASVVLGTGADMFTGLRLRTGGGQVNAQKTNFGPQLGFAWSPREVAGHDFASKLVIRGGFGIAYNGVAQSNTLDVRFNPPFVDNSQNLCAPGASGCQPSNQLLYIGSFPADINNPNGYASNPNAILQFNASNLPIDPTTGQAKCCVDLTALPNDLPTTHTFHYTLGTEYDLGHNWVVSAGYQGSFTHNETQHYNLYDVGAARGFMLNPVVHGITIYANDGNGRFNALLLELKHPFGHSFTLDTQYRLSHALDPGSNAYAGGFYQWNMATNYATSDFDTRHVFKMYGIWSPTIFQGNRSWMEKVAGGWTISGILNAHSGFPWTPQYNFQGQNDIGNGYDPVFNFGQFSGGSSSDAGSGSFLPAAYLGGFHPNYGSNVATSGGGAFFNAPTFPQGTLFDCLFPNPDPTLCPSGQQGFAGLPSYPGVARNSFYGPGYFDVDATLSKSFGLPPMKVLGEGAKLEFRINFFNLFNKVNLNGNGGAYSNGIMSDVLNSHFGGAQSALGSRVIEMQARFNF